MLTYGATAFWLINSLPPNSGDSRLPSLYVMGLGFVITMAGLAIRSLRSDPNKPTSLDEKAIPTRYGMIGLVAIIALLIFIISRL